MPERPSAPVAVSARMPASFVRMGLALAAFGYGLVSVIDGALHRLEPDEPTAAVCLFVALLLSRRWPTLAGSAGLLVVLGEMLSGFSTEGLGSGSAVVLPVFISGAGLFLGEAAALWAGALGAGGATAAALLLGPPLGSGHMDASAELKRLAIIVVVSAIAAALTYTAVRSHRLALDASERARRRYLDLLENAPDGLVALDGLGVVTEANGAAAAMLGEGLRGRPLEEVLAGLGARTSRPLGEGRPEAPAVIEIGHGPRARTVEVTARAGESAGGAELTRLVLRDTTERRALEEQLLHAQRLETVGLLAGGVAHDFNNLLTAIGGNAEVLEDDPRPDVRELAGEILDAQRRGSALTRQLLAFARRDARRPERMDLAEALRGMERLLGRILGERNRLVLTAAGGVPVLADRAQIEQVALNLVTNARDASPAGADISVTVRALGRESARALGSSEGGAVALLEVADRGSGMSPETRARIFEPFFTTKARGQGTGLGLSTVHGIVAQSGGQLAVDTVPGGGSTFRIFLPLAGASPAAEEPLLTPVPAGGSGERVLVVEDDPSVRALVERVLRAAGYVVGGAGSGRAALAAIEAAGPEGPAPQLLVTDMAMPGMDGTEVARRLRERCPGIAVLFMSGYFDDGGGRAPDPGVLRKPFTPEELLSQVRKALEGRAAA